ncbi:MAG: hypothetical protein Q4E07_02575 [Eubacteriales bacterium]|nr:hypothetical protein [Eubacteriales bacterium]
MKKLENLPEIADEMLKELEPDSFSWAKIVNEAAERQKPRRGFSTKRIIAFACSFAIVLFSGLTLYNNFKEDPRQIRTVAAGGKNAPQMVALSVPRGSISLSNSKPSQNIGIWASGNGGNFPLIAAEGRYYRMLTNPTAIPSEMLGRNIGSVGIFTDEPALQNANAQVISNVVPQGSEVYAVSGMDGAVVAANVDGSLRVFQRVSFSGHALVGGENLISTLGNVKPIAMRLSGVGTITDSDKISTLFATLRNADYLSASAPSKPQKLLIEFENKLVLQLYADSDSLYACGSFSCPDFFSEFAQSL